MGTRIGSGNPAKIARKSPAARRELAEFPEIRKKSPENLQKISRGSCGGDGTADPAGLPCPSFINPAKITRKSVARKALYPEDPFLGHGQQEPFLRQERADLQGLVSGRPVLRLHDCKRPGIFGPWMARTNSSVLVLELHTGTEAVQLFWPLIFFIHQAKM